jgi:hypothetical protein
MTTPATDLKARIVAVELDPFLVLAALDSGQHTPT